VIVSYDISDRVGYMCLSTLQFRGECFNQIIFLND